MLKTKNLTFQYKNGQPFRFPDVTVATGEDLLILGESGCGKTTLLHLLAGLLKPQSGEIWIDNTNIANLSPTKMDNFRGQHIGLVYQKSYFIESLTVLDNLLISPFSPNKDKAISIAKRLKIDKLLHKLPSKLSVGEQQRATIARALINEPTLILADEPTSALDHTNCEAVVQLLKEQATASNASLVIVTHDDRLKGEITNRVDLQKLMEDI